MNLWDITCRGLPKERHTFPDPPTKRVRGKEFKEIYANKVKLYDLTHGFCCAYVGPHGAYAVYKTGISYVVAHFPQEGGMRGLTKRRERKCARLCAYRLAVQGGPPDLTFY